MKMASDPKISIIIPTWNNREMLKLCLRSVAKNSKLPHQIVVHVNEGSDGTLDWVRENGIEHSWTPQNVGICQAVNLAFERCRGEYLVYLNDDMYALPGWDRPLYEHAAQVGDREPYYISGTMIQSHPMSPKAIQAGYGSDPQSFEEKRLLGDYRAGKLACGDWSGATWPPCCIHRRWWNMVGGYSVEFSPGFYSDIDFSLKLWQVGCRRFRGVGSSLVYHFGETTTARVRGPRKRNVKRARILFLKKWGILPSTFVRCYLRTGQPYRDPLSEPTRRDMFWERLRLHVLSRLHCVPRPRKALR